VEIPVSGIQIEAKIRRGRIIFGIVFNAQNHTLSHPRLNS
jgi:hypothetical protein